MNWQDSRSFRTKARIERICSLREIAVTIGEYVLRCNIERIAIRTRLKTNYQIARQRNLVVEMLLTPSLYSLPLVYLLLRYSYHLYPLDAFKLKFWGRNAYINLREVPIS
jgi:hypothetical protein